jgi:hypothetical protein
MFKNFVPSFSHVVYGDGFYPLVRNETVKWFGNESMIYIFSEDEGTKFLNISLLGNRLNSTKSLSIFLNDKLVDKIYADNVLERVHFKKGENILKLRSNEPCEIPVIINKNNKDPRCLSLGIKKMEIIDNANIPKNEIIFGSNWYNPELNNKTNTTERWSSKNSTLIIYSDENKETFLNITLFPYKIKEMEIKVNNKSIGIYTQPHNILEKITLNKGLNEIRFISTCDIPALVEKNNSDYRCLTFLLRNITQISQLPTNTFIYGSGFYAVQIDNKTNITYYPASDVSKIYIISDEEKEVFLNVSTIPYRIRSIKLYLNNELIGTYYQPHSILEKINLKKV